MLIIRPIPWWFHSRYVVDLSSSRFACWDKLPFAEGSVWWMCVPFGWNRFKFGIGSRKKGTVRWKIKRGTTSQVSLKCELVPDRGNVAVSLPWIRIHNLSAVSSKSIPTAAMPFQGSLIN